MLIENDRYIRWRALALSVGFIGFCVFGIIIPWLYGVISLIKKIF